MEYFLNQKVNTNITFPIVLGDGWYDLESHSNIYWKWATAKSVLYVDENHKYKSVDIVFKNHCTKKQVKFFVKKKNSNLIIEECVKQYGIDETGIVTIDLKNTDIIIIESDWFCPNDIGVNNDTRALSIMVFGFLYKNENDQIDVCPIENIKNKQCEYHKEFIKTDCVITETDRYFSRKTCIKDTNVLDDITVLITCNGNRVDFGKKAYKSVIDAGIKNVSIVLTGNDESYTNWARSIEDLHSLVIIEEDKNNNDSWIRGIKSIRTNWTIILHDDDVITKNLTDELMYLSNECKFGIWNGSVVHLESNEVLLKNTIDINVDRGIYSVKMIRDLIEKYHLTISPIHGVFRTKEIIECLEQWEREFGNNSRFYTKPTFVVGNDIFIWLYFTKNENDLCFVTNAQGSKCISHIDSATEIDLRKKIHSRNFDKIYSEVKRVYISKTIKNGIILYLPDFSEKHIKCLDNLYEYRHSKYNIPIVVYTDSYDQFPSKYNYNFNRTPKIPNMERGKWGITDKYAAWSFIDGIRIAREREWDYFFVYEWDCKIGKDDWYDILWQQHLSWQTKPIMTGTPVFKCPPGPSGNILQGSTEYIYSYSNECKLNMLVEHVYPLSLYTNGALAFYDTNKICEYYEHELNNNIENKSDHIDELGPWDMFLGTCLINELNEKSFEKVGWLPSAYSGCGDYFYNQQQRDYMLNSGMKVAVHQNKYQ
jgi:hypothetical protein